MGTNDDIKNAGQNPTEPTDQGEDSEQRRDTAQQVWRDRSGVPGGTPEEGGRSAGSGSEIEDDAIEPGQKRAPEVDDVDDIDEKR
jgi:hypothetical protein